MNFSHFFLLALKQPLARSGSQVSIGFAEEGLGSEKGQLRGQQMAEPGLDFLFPDSGTTLSLICGPQRS